MSNLTRHQKPIIKLPRAWKLILALFVLALLVVFKAAFYVLEKDGSEKTGQSPSAVQSAEVSAPSAESASGVNASVSPDATPKKAATSIAGTVIGQLKITQTPTGFLNVRGTPSSSGQIITQVPPGVIFDYTVSQNGWYEINLPSGQTGWVSAQFVTTNLNLNPVTTKNPSIIKRAEDGDGADE